MAEIKRQVVRAWLACNILPVIVLSVMASLSWLALGLLRADLAAAAAAGGMWALLRSPLRGPFCLHLAILALALARIASTGQWVWGTLRGTLVVSVQEMANRSCWVMCTAPLMANAMLVVVVPGFAAEKEWLSFICYLICVGCFMHLTPSRSLLQLMCTAPFIIVFDFLKQCSMLVPSSSSSSPSALPACPLIHAPPMDATTAAAACNAGAYAQCAATSFLLHVLRRGPLVLLSGLLPAAVLHLVFTSQQQHSDAVHSSGSHAMAAEGGAVAPQTPSAHSSCGSGRKASGDGVVDACGGGSGASAGCSAGAGGACGPAAASAAAPALLSRLFRPVCCWMDWVDEGFERVARGVDPSLVVVVPCAPLGLFYFGFTLLSHYFPHSFQIDNVSSEEWLLVMGVFFMLGRYSCSFDVLPLMRQIQAQLTASFAKQAHKPSLLELMDSVRQQVMGNSQGDVKEGMEMSDDRPEDHIRVLEMLGEGMSGKVYRGLWRGTVVAVKSMLLPSNMGGAATRERMAIMEAAISSALSHPNIVQTYTYSVRPVRDASSQAAKSVGQGFSDLSGIGDNAFSDALFEDLQASPSRGPPRSMMGSGSHGFEVSLVLEYADCGTLRDALDRGEFLVDIPEASPAPGDGPVAPPGASISAGRREVDYESVLRTAADIAKGMLHLHALNVVHSDLKARNVLLLSSASDPRGFTAKVSDFGLSFKMDAADTHVSNMFQGTICYSAPEVLLNGYQGKAADVFAFGITMWEIYTGAHPYQGMAKALLGHFVAEQGLRPAFAASAPPEYVALATRCWSAEPSARPTFETIVSILTELADAATEQRLSRVVAAGQHSERLPRVQAGDKALDRLRVLRRGTSEHRVAWSCEVADGREGGSVHSLPNSKAAAASDAEWDALEASLDPY